MTLSSAAPFSISCKQVSKASYNLLFIVHLTDLALKPGEGSMLKPGMIFTIEPMVNLGRPHVKVLSDGWTAVTRDRSLSAQFEHTVGVTKDGVEVFTLSPKGLDKPPICRAD